MGDYKFDTFYYTEDQSNEHYLSEIENLSDEEYNTSYKGKMYCPWCKGPQLGLVNSKTGNLFLRTYRNQKHMVVNDELCPYEFDTASNKQVKAYIRELKEKKRIKSLLESTMRKLFNSDVSKKINEKHTNNHTPNPLLFEAQTHNNTTVRKIIPHYSFKSWGKNIPSEQLLIVYGKVFITLKDIQYKNEELQTFIHFKDIYSRKLITACKKPHSLQVSEGYYYAVLLGECRSKKSNGYTYYNIWLNSPIDESILLKPFSPV